MRARSAGRRLRTDLHALLVSVPAVGLSRDSGASTEEFTAVNMAPKDHEDKPRLLCNTYPGGRSAAYDKWEEEFLDAAAGKGDEEGVLDVSVFSVAQDAGGNAFGFFAGLLFTVRCLATLGAQDSKAG